MRRVNDREKMKLNNQREIGGKENNPLIDIDGKVGQENVSMRRENGSRDFCAFIQCVVTLVNHAHVFQRVEVATDHLRMN